MVDRHKGTKHNNVPPDMMPRQDITLPMKDGNEQTAPTDRTAKGHPLIIPVYDLTPNVQDVHTTNDSRPATGWKGSVKHVPRDGEQQNIQINLPNVNKPILQEQASGKGGQALCAAITNATPAAPSDMYRDNDDPDHDPFPGGKEGAHIIKRAQYQQHQECRVWIHDMHCMNGCMHWNILVFCARVAQTPKSYGCD